MRTVLHLVGRFFGSLSRRPPDEVDEAWALGHLNQAEILLWRRMSAPDRRHAIAVARAVGQGLRTVEADSLNSGWFSNTAEFERSAIAAALMHDSGKVVADIGTLSRVAATVFWALAPPSLVRDWLTVAGPRRLLAEYHDHPRLGAELLADAGSSRLVHTWAGEHHRRPQNWTVPAAIGHLLKDCDDD